jgi:hypothetical protein
MAHRAVQSKVPLGADKAAADVMTPLTAHGNE